MFDLANETKDESDDAKGVAYAKLLLATRGDEDPRKKSPDQKAFEGALKRVAKMGTILGYAFYAFSVGQEITEDEWKTLAHDRAGYKNPKTGKGPSDKQLERLATAASEAFADEQNRLANPEGSNDDEDGEEDEEKAQRKRDARDDGR